jgi:predicted 2-oxoglutarate/Fe(II)-dependent dioxygenase YbiX
VIYLNDDYEGGELIFPHRDVKIKPKAGTFIGFPGNRHYMHGVNEVIGSDRYTFSVWARFEEAYNHDIFDSGKEN